MFYIRREGEIIRQGFNFYPWSDVRSRGFILHVGTFFFRCRYSYTRKQLLLAVEKMIDGYTRCMWSNYRC